METLQKENTNELTIDVLTIDVKKLSIKDITDTKVHNETNIQNQGLINPIESGLQECIIENNTLIFNCPHCYDITEVLVEMLACRIFRHGYFIQFIKNPQNTNTQNTNDTLYTLLDQINPHASQQECLNLKSRNDVVGCCLPFQIIELNGKNFVKACDYI